MSDPPWHIYLLRTRKGALYTGITLDVARRFAEHTGNRARGAKYLRNMAPLSLEYSAPVGDKSAALQLEHQIKKLPKAEKERIVRDQPDARDLLLHLAGSRPT